MLSVRFQVGVSLLLAPTQADKRDPKAPFPLVYTRRFTREYLPELRREPGLTESTGFKYSENTSLLKYKQKHKIIKLFCTF